MKAAACILITLWSILLVEPLLANFNVKSAYSECSKKQTKKSSCSKSKSSKPENKEEKNDCENNRCNPLMSCPTGNFYFFGQLQLTLTPITLVKQKAILINDNRILKHLSECWHPPEII